MLQRERHFSRSPTVFTPSTLSRGRGVQTCFGVTIFLTGIVVDIAETGQKSIPEPIPKEDAVRDPLLACQAVNKER